MVKYEIEENLLDLMPSNKRNFVRKSSFLVITSYAIRSSHMSLYNLLKSSLNFDYGKCSSGELGIRESGKKRGFILCKLCKMGNKIEFVFLFLKFLQNSVDTDN